MKAEFMRYLSRHPAAVVGLALLVLQVIAILFAPWLTSYSPVEADPLASLEPPSLAHWFGTDVSGMDICARVIYATRINLLISLTAVARSLLDLLPEGGRIVEGDIRLDGASVLGLSAAEQGKLLGARIALIGTNAKALLDPVATVGGQIARVMRAHRACGHRGAWAAADLLAKFGIVNPERRAKAYRHEHSGGMAQRVVIAMAMVTNPDIVLADDATLGLDATIQVQVLDLLVKRCRELGAGVVLITHDLGIIAHCCDRVAIMKGGRIVELGEVGRFLQGPRDDYSRTLLDAARVRPTPRTGQSEGTMQGRAEAAHARPLLDVRRLEKFFPIAGGTEVVRAIDEPALAGARADRPAAAARPPASMERDGSAGCGSCSIWSTCRSALPTPIRTN